MNRTDHAVAVLRSRVRDGRLEAGERLPRESDLATELGTSVTTVRAAVRDLVGAGLLRVRQGDGTYVTQLDADALLAPMAALADLAEPATLLECHQVRRILEPAATAAAALALSDDDIAGLAALAATMDAATNVDTFIDADRQFHATIAAASGNQLLAGLTQALTSRGTRMHVHRARTNADALGAARAAHREILAAITARDAEWARAAATAHLADGEQWLRRVLATPTARPRRTPNS